MTQQSRQANSCKMMMMVATPMGWPRDAVPTSCLSSLSNEIRAPIRVYAFGSVHRMGRSYLQYTHKVCQGGFATYSPRQTALPSTHIILISKYTTRHQQ